MAVQDPKAAKHTADAMQGKGRRPKRRKAMSPERAAIMEKFLQARKDAK